MQVSHLSFGTLVPSTVGFDRFFTSAERLLSTDQSTAIKFPPHNIIRLDEHRYIIEMAVAGFTLEEIDVTVQEGVLSIRGTKSDETLVGTYLHRGIGNRNFVKTFQLSDSVEIRNAALTDGVLRIDLENVIPESRKPRKIPLTTTTSQLLTESK